MKDAKDEGHKTTSPQESPENGSKTRIIFQCDQCDSQLESKGLLQAHRTTHKDPNSEHAFELCVSFFTNQDEFDRHVHISHAETEWNCNDCPFQSNDAQELLNHLKITGHQPSKKLDKKKVFKEYKQCFTCKMEFDGYYNLMNHRKVVHPSSRKCKNFPGSCAWGNDCCYVHHVMKK